MINFLVNNIGTIIVALIILIIVSLIITKLIRDKKTKTPADADVKIVQVREYVIK